MVLGKIKVNGKISGHQQKWPRPLPGAILIPSALLVAADSTSFKRYLLSLGHMWSFGYWFANLPA
jgi:hypothetical protein